ncbi:class III extradiol ring-cleavage dioxygenase family protein [Serratia marcescens]|uniref:hypothetical protein n=1 Tax=Serratia marcescens TaxID=615 RepID=UPI003989EF40
MTIIEMIKNLAQRNSVVASADVLAVFAELEAKDKRIAELEAIRADASQVFKEIGNELGCNPDNESIMMAIDALKERLATPVRLVDYRNSPDMHTKQYYEAIGFNQGIDACSAAVRTAGFTVEGDE